MPSYFSINFLSLYLFYRFYEIVESCVVRRKKWCDLPMCETTNWSSLAPDPKSEFTSVDSITGRMKRYHFCSLFYFY